MSLPAIKIGVTAETLGEDPRETPRLARTLGFEGLQFEAYGSSINLLELSGSGRREFLRLLTTQAQQLVGLRLDLGTKGLSPGADVDRLLDRVDAVLECAASMSARLVCIELGPLPAAPVQNKPRPRITQEQAGLILLPFAAPVVEAPPEPAPRPPAPAFVSQVDSALAELGRRADAYSVIVAFRSDLASFASLEHAVKTAACPWFGIDLDPASVLRDEWNLDEVFSGLGGLVRHVRGRDAVAGADRRARPAEVGAGSTEWPALLSNLQAADYQGWITLDPSDMTDRRSAAQAGQKFLAGVVQALRA